MAKWNLFLPDEATPDLDGRQEATGTAVGSKFAQDVYIAGGATIEVNLDSANDSVEIFQATHDNVNLNANLQVADADVANGNPVPISDAGGSLTVDGTVAVSGFIDSGNSTTTPLGGGATFTGASIDTTNYSGAIIQIFSDQESATGGFAFQTSIDGTNWDHGHTYTYVGGSSGRHYTFQLPGQYGRVVYTNGATPQTTFRLSTKLLPAAGFSHDHPIDAGLEDEHPAAVTRAINTGKDPAGTYINSKLPGLGFSTSTLLTNGQTYDSGVLDLQGYTQVQTQVLSDVDGTWVVDFIRDSGGTDVLRTLTVPHTGSSDMLTFAAPAFTPYVRYRFTADAAGQTDFYFDTKFTNQAISPQILNLESFISPKMTAVLDRSVSVGQDPEGNYNNEKIGGKAFRTTTPLAASATYSSGVLDLQGFSQVQTHILADQDGTINIYWYTDSAGTDQVRLLTIPYTAADGFQTFAAPAFTPYVKYEFTNDGSLQTDFFFDTKFLTKAISAQILTPSGAISDLMTAALTRSVLVGKSSGGGGSYVNVKVNPSGTLECNVSQGSHDDLQANVNLQVADTDVSNGNPVPISDAGGSLTVDGTVAATQSGTWNINDISGTISLPTGAATAANQLPDGHNVTVDNAAGASAVNIQDGGNSITVDGSELTAIQAAVEIMDDWDETNRCAVNLISGQAGVAADAGTVGASTPRTVNASSDTPATATVSPSTGSTTVRAANTGRMGLVIWNDSATDCYIKHGSTASTTDFTVKLGQDEAWILEQGDYNGIVTGITSSGTATLRVTEMT